MNTRAKSLVFALLATATVSSVAFADSNPHLNPPRVYTGVYQPHGKPTKSSAFAPRANRSGRRGCTRCAGRKHASPGGCGARKGESHRR